MTNPVRICLIGAGRIGRVHAESILRHIPEAGLAAVVDANPEVLEAASSEFGVEARFATLDDALSGARFEAVVITAPTFMHKSLAVASAEAGKHIFLEKPMALTLQECDAIMQAVNRNAVILQMGFMRRFDPEFEVAVKRIEAGDIGRPMMIKSLTHGPGLPPAWARDLKTSNGILAEVNSHDWDTTRWLMSANPERVYAEVANFKGAARGVTTENFYDNVLVNIRFEGGGLGSISGVCPCDYGYDARVEIVGEKGILQIGELRGQAVVLGVDREQGLLSPVFRTWPQRFAWAYMREMEHFVQCIHKQTPARVGGEDGRWAVAGVLAGTKSFLEERPVYLTEVLEAAATPPSP